MPKSEVFRINYYVGSVLAQGGNVWIEDSKIVFSPTSSIDRAMGAKDVLIPFSEIQDLDFKGELMRTFLVKTAVRTHKFEGNHAKKIWELLEKSLAENKTSASPVSSLPRDHRCDQCNTPLEPCFSFCPSCAAPIKTKCTSCRHAIMPHWAACAYCGWKFSPHPAAGESK